MPTLTTVGRMRGFFEDVTGPVGPPRRHLTLRRRLGAVFLTLIAALQAFPSDENPRLTESRPSDKEPGSMGTVRRLRKKAKNERNLASVYVFLVRNENENQASGFCA
ncbi:hypothetical protein HPB50_010869 [Hyalomma asiaticum]|uniref:Uncharacterized protein n=1 Tax=Hyalomma asiaticum TaxID=266040 RepID=A0ACB7RKM1_HYAAI|nr:hypothetical protein HPB50_010869 [Hyalomma asiaticum]